MGYSGAWGNRFHEKDPKSKISWHCPFKQIIMSITHYTEDYSGNLQTNYSKFFLFSTKTNRKVQFHVNPTSLKKRVSVGLKRLSWKRAKRRESPGVTRTTSSRNSRQERRKMFAAYVTKRELGFVKDSALQFKPWSREYWMIFRVHSFIAVVWFGSAPIPFSPFSSQ